MLSSSLDVITESEDQQTFLGKAPPGVISVMVRLLRSADQRREPHGGENSGCLHQAAVPRCTDGTLVTTNVSLVCCLSSVVCPSWLDYCDQLISVTNPMVGKTLVVSIRQVFLDVLMEPSLIQTQIFAIVCPLFVCKLFTFSTSSPRPLHHPCPTIGCSCTH